MENKRQWKKRRLDEAPYSGDLVGALADFVQNGQHGSVTFISDKSQVTESCIRIPFFEEMLMSQT
eukprot:8026156-Alexandrium_andersonii.AAC.1